jgi:hypothetical protein
MLIVSREGWPRVSATPRPAYQSFRLTARLIRSYLHVVVRLRVLQVVHVVTDQLQDAVGAGARVLTELVIRGDEISSPLNAEPVGDQFCDLFLLPLGMLAPGKSALRCDR